MNFAIIRTASSRTFSACRGTSADARKFPAAAGAVVDGLFLPELAERYVAYRRTGIFRGQGVFSDTRRETFRQGTDRAFLRGERIGSLRYGRRDNPIEKQCFRQFSSSSARGRSGAVVGCGSDLPGDRDDGTEGYRCDRAPYRLRRAACGRECGVRLCGPYASVLSHALFVAGLSEIGGVEGGLLPADVRRVRDALIEFPIG